MKLEEIIAAIGKRVQPVRRTAVEAAVKLALGSTLLAGGCSWPNNWFVEKQVSAQDVEPKVVQMEEHLYQVYSATATYRGKQPCKVQQTGLWIALYPEKKTWATAYTILPTAAFDFKHQQGKTLTARVVCPGDRWNFSLLESTIDLPFKVEEVPAPPPPPPPPRPQIYVTGLRNPPLYSQSEEVRFAVGIRNLSPTETVACEAKAKLRQLRRRGSEFAGKFLFNPKNKVKVQYDSAREYTPYDITVHCGSLPVSPFSVYIRQPEERILKTTEKKPMRIVVEPLKEEKENLKPVCTVPPAGDIIEELNYSNGRSGDPLAHHIIPSPLVSRYKVTMDEDDQGVEITFAGLSCTDAENDRLEYRVKFEGNQRGHIRTPPLVKADSSISLTLKQKIKNNTTPPNRPDALVLSVLEYSNGQEQPPRETPFMWLKVGIDPKNDWPQVRQGIPNVSFYLPFGETFEIPCDRYFEDADGDRLTCYAAYFCGQNMFSQLGEKGWFVKEVPGERISCPQPLHLKFFAWDGFSKESISGLIDREIRLYSHPSPYKGDKLTAAVRVYGDSKKAQQEGCAGYMDFSPLGALVKALEEKIEYWPEGVASFKALYKTSTSDPFLRPIRVEAGKLTNEQKQAIQNLLKEAKAATALSFAATQRYRNNVLVEVEVTRRD